MTIEDKLAIHDAIARYSYAYDSKDADAFASLFVEEGAFEVIVSGDSDPLARLSSRRAIREWAVRRHHLRAASQARHYQSGLLFDELSERSATTRTMLLVTTQRRPDTTPLLHVTGVYCDEWRKTPEGWRLVRREAHIDRDPGFERHWA